MFSPDQLAVPDKEHLHHSLSVVLIHGNDVLVLSRAVRNLLLLGHLFYIIVQIPIAGGSLKIQLFRRFLHFCLQVL